MTSITDRIWDIINTKITPNRRPGAWAVARFLKEYDPKNVLKLSDDQIDDALRLELKKISKLNKHETERALDYSYLILSATMIKLYSNY